MATHFSTLAWRIPRTEEPGGLQSTGSQSRTRLSGSHTSTHTHTHTHYLLSNYYAAGQISYYLGGLGTVTLANLQLRELQHRDVK